MHGQGTWGKEDQAQIVPQAPKVNLSRTTLLLTRPEAASHRFAEQVARQVGRFREVVISPVMEIVPVAADLLGAEEAEWIFTSANAVERSPQPGKGAAAWCVGPHTAEAARRAGFDLRAVAPDAASLRDLIRADPPGRPMLHAAGRHRRGGLAAALRASGIAARAVTVYDQRACPLTEAALRRLGQPGDVVAPVFSPRSARLLCDAAAGRVARITAVAISPAAAAGWKPVDAESVIVAENPDATGMLAAINSLFDADRSA